MKTYSVTCTYYGSCVIEVVAESEQDAIDAATNTEIDLDGNLGDVKYFIE